ncbi:hypothetical protein DSCA_11450 [Desulfosarcina alkanivorans]|uniref:Sulfotransferase domain-containing protein n=1 Tax=Desulfosarcina alkanivorans TaxID=571177 RepID=A0A5K7YFG6_9BACT|nr:hypothetical protein [Desulfosarcina alkanivorans]BBO67215.1 hypothetical protein DSCA_11450 [Desulfosarcina alkanivorans]
MKNKVIFISGLSHVGSTLIDFTLGTHPRIIGLGEIYTALRPELNRINQNLTCSCGQPVDTCFFWKEAAKRLRPVLNAPMDRKYKIVLQTFNDLYGDDYILVDSSKSIDALKCLTRIPDLNLKIIHLLRDVRSWSISRIDYRKRKPENYTSRGFYINKLSYTFGKKIFLIGFLIPYITRRPSFYFLLWYFQNKKAISYLNENKLSFLQLGYDELGLRPGKMIDNIFSYIDQNADECQSSSESSKSHVLIGNPKKSDPERRRGILYDNRWMFRNEWLISAALFRRIMKFNADQVYGNIQKGNIW